ncbi:MAG: glycosyltransferase family 2 protein [Victivallaceae bacterium]
MPVSCDPRVCVIILNFNGKSHLEYCLPSILKSDYENMSVLLVDNMSTDDSLEYARREFPEIEILVLDSNKGYAGGNNEGIKAAIKKGADIVVLANNDILVHPQWINSAVRAFDADSQVGFVGCDVFGDFSSVPVEDYHEACSKWKNISMDYTAEYISGMALFIKKELFRNVGFLDEKYFLYSEETDLEFRGKLIGYKSMKTNVPIWHYSSGSTQNIPVKASVYAIRNSIRMSIKFKQPLFLILKNILCIYKTAVNPFLGADINDRLVSRLRPKNCFINFFIVSYCVFWNLLNLHETFKARKADYVYINNFNGDY